MLPTRFWSRAHAVRRATLLALAWPALAAAQAPAAAASAPPPPPMLAQVMPGLDAMSDAERRCWSQRTFDRARIDLREPFAVSFGNLRNGMTVRAPFWIDFGIRGMGVIPAGNAHPKAGHHHLLVDTPLPMDHQAKIPFNDKHRHFGKGQTGAVLDLPPGKHTLRLLFADHDHKPYFVFSPEVTITVEGRRSDPAPAIDNAQFETSCARWYDNEVTRLRGDGKQVFVRNLRAREAVGGSFMLGLGVVGWGVAPAGSSAKDVGWFAVDVAGRARNQRIELKDGRTEALVDLPPGDYTATPVLMAPDGKSTLLAGTPLPFQVNGR
jgi:Domain of unknown function (DUF4399)